MTTDTITETTSQSRANLSATEYWRDHLRSVMAPLLSATGTYTPSEQTAHLQFMDKHIAPNLGPLPTDPHPAYTTPSSLVGSPFDPSLNLTSSGKATVRFDYDVLAPTERTGPDPFGEQMIRDLYHAHAEVVGGDTRWIDSLIDYIWLTPEETDVARANIPAHVTVPPGMVGFALDGPKQSLKAYVPAMRKAIATGQSSSEIIFEALRRLEPLGSEIRPAVDSIHEYIANCTHDATLIMVGVDCVDPTIHKDTRLKCYCHTSGNSFAIVRDVMTLGGRLADESTAKGIEILKSLWPVLMNEHEHDQPESSQVDGALGTIITDETWSKPEKLKGTEYSGLQFTIELAPGRLVPETKVYIPLFQYTPDFRAAEKNVETVLKRLNHEWGLTGRYSQTMEAIFGKDTMYGQTYLTFSYSQRKGVYTTSYFAKPIDGEPSGVKEGDFQYI